jgi:hypothetical protein
MTGFMNADGSALVGGLTSAGIGQALQIDPLGNVATQAWMQATLQQGKGYMASCGLLNVAAGNYPLCIFNPANSGKNILLYSLRTSSGTASVNSISVFLQTVTSNPAYASTAIITGSKLGGSASVIAATCTFSGTSQTLTAPYLQVEVSTTPVELFVNGSTLLLPNGSAMGATIFVQTYASGFSSITARWIEF